MAQIMAKTFDWILIQLLLLALKHFLNNIFYLYCLPNIDLYIPGVRKIFSCESQICDEKPNFQDIKFFLKMSQCFTKFTTFSKCKSKKRVRKEKIFSGSKLTRVKFGPRTANCVGLTKTYDSESWYYFFDSNKAIVFYVIDLSQSLKLSFCSELLFSF